MTMKAIGEALVIREKTVASVCRAYLKRGFVPMKKESGRHKKLQKRQIKQLVDP